MPSSPEHVSPQPHEREQRQFLREQVFLAEQAATTGVQVLPGEQWGIHYPQPEAVRNETIAGVLAGKIATEAVAKDFKPDAVMYDLHAIEDAGLEHVSAKLRDMTTYISQYDYERFAHFLSRLKGSEVDAPTAQVLYDSIAQSRVRKKMHDAYGFTGKKQLEDSFRQEAQRILSSEASGNGLQAVFDVLKFNWLNQSFGFVGSQEHQGVIQALSEKQQQLYKTLQEPFTSYVETGSEESFVELTDHIRNELPTVKEVQEDHTKNEGDQEFEDDLEQYKDQVGPPGSPEDPGIPPDDQDEYHTPEELPTGTEKGAPAPIFTITPSGISTKPLVGYYISGRKSYFDIATKTWSKRKQLVPYGGRAATDKRQTIAGQLDAGIKSLPIPNNYALDASSLTWTGPKPEIKRDQNGCFYLDAKGQGSFSIDFAPEVPRFASSPVAEDASPLTDTAFMKETEQFLVQLTGNPLEKAEAIRTYLLKRHAYPGGGDLTSAQALQLKLRKESTGANYIQNLEASEYLECYSANTLFIAMLRKAGIPSRLVVGHHLDHANDGKAFISSATGHAWSEVWDGKEWRRIDATPNARKDEQKDQKKTESTPSEQADDSGVPNPSGESSQGQGEGSGGQGSDSMQEISDTDFSQAKKSLKHATEAVDRAQKEKSALDEAISKAESFQNLDQLRQQADQADIFDDMKQDLEEKIAAKEDMMKEEFRDQLDQMSNDGFLDEKDRDTLESDLQQKNAKALDKLQEQLAAQNRLYEKYQEIREDVLPYVDELYDYFIERLPRQKEVTLQEDALTRQGHFNRRSVMRARNLLFGNIKNPSEIQETAKPLFLASIMLDVSGSMEGQKLKDSQKLLVFYSELFSRIQDEFGYMRFAINVFSDNIKEIKTFDQDYTAPRSYAFRDGSFSTIKVRLMEALTAKGGTNMLDAIKAAASDLNEETFQYPDYASALYFIGDGGDSLHNGSNIKRFLHESNAVRGFGEHIYSAIMLGSQNDRRQLAEIFGDEHTTVAGDFDTLLEESMMAFDNDIEFYLRNKTV